MSKVRFTLRLDKELADECDKKLKKANCESRNELIERAINFYIKYLDMDENLDVISPYLENMIKSTIEYTENRLCKNIFKLAVEQAKILNILAAFHNIDNETLSRLQIRCVDEVKRINGVFDLEKAVKLQRGED